MVSLIRICSELFLSDLIRSGLSDQNWSESDLKIWPYSLPFEVGKILSGFRSDPTNSDQICSDLVGHGKDLVDSYHYNNHKATDILCATYCNPAPMDGSAPNLVQLVEDKHGEMQMQRSFNTQVSILL